MTARAHDTPVGAGAGASGWRAVGVASWLALVVPSLMASFLIAFHVHQFTSVSSIDEQSHFAQAVDIAYGHLSARGDPISDRALREIACRTRQDGLPQLCPTGADPSDYPKALDRNNYPEAGFIYTTDHPPLYYAVSGLGGRALFQARAVGSLFDGIRLMGIFWVLLGNALLWLTLRRLRVPPAAIFAALALLCTTPATIYTASIVNPDVTSVPMMALVVYVSLRCWSREWSWGWLAPVGALVVACKITNTTVVVGGVVLLSALAWTGSRAGRAGAMRDWFRCCGALGVGGLSVLVGWTIRYHLTDAGYSTAQRAPGIPALSGISESHFDPRWLLHPELLQVARTELNPLVMPAKFLGPAWVAFFAAVTALLLLAAAVRVLWLRLAGPATALAVTSLVFPLVGGALFQIYNYLAFKTWLPPAIRYFYCVLAVQTLVLALSLRSRWSRLSVALMTGAAFVAYVRFLRSG